ncbi:MAG: ribose-phosphate diphosphokinase [Desulfotalea sp.]
MTNIKNIIVISTDESSGLAVRVAEELGITYTAMITKEFSDGERYHAFPTSLTGKDVVIVATTHNDKSHQDLLDFIQGCRYWNANSINVVIPFLGYSTMERVKPGSHEIPKGITRTRQIFKARPHFVAFVDLHSESVLHAHDGNISTKHVRTDDLIVQKIKELSLDNFVLVSPDYGYSKRVARIASLLDCPHTAADKDRFDVDKTLVGQVSAVVKGKIAIICDDMIRTGGSIIQTAERCMDAGASQVYLLATHLVLSGDARSKLLDSSVVKVIGSDSYPNVKNDGKIELYSLAPLLSDMLRQRLMLTKN